MDILVTSASGANDNGYGAILRFGPEGEFTRPFSSDPTFPGPAPAQPGPESRGRITGYGPGCGFVQFLQPEMLPSGSQLSGVFLAIREMVRVTGLPVLA
jgi:hypothetical protein